MFRDDGAGRRRRGRERRRVQAGEPGVGGRRASSCARAACAGRRVRLDAHRRRPARSRCGCRTRGRRRGGAGRRTRSRGLALDRAAAGHDRRHVRARRGPRHVHRRQRRGRTGVAFGDVPPNAWVAAAGAASVAPGGVAFYPHTFTAGSAGAVELRRDQAPSPRDARAGATSFVRDLDCDGASTRASRRGRGARSRSSPASACAWSRATPAPRRRGGRLDRDGHAHRRASPTRTPRRRWARRRSDGRDDRARARAAAWC